MSAPKSNSNDEQHLKNNRRILSIFSKGIGGVIFFVFQFLIFAKVMKVFYLILIVDFNTKCTKISFEIIENILGSQRRFAYKRSIIVKSSLSFRNLDS